MEDKLRKEVRDYIRQEYHLNGGGMVSGNLTDLILGFAEPKEKRIEELEQKLEQTEKDLADYQFNYPTIKELTEGTCFAHLKSLEQENAELKEKLNFRTQYYQGEKAKEQLTKAKEIISAFVEWANWEGANCPNFKDIQSKAEQFLKEIEK